MSMSNVEITNQVLTNKYIEISFPEKVIRLSFEYLLALIAEEYSNERFDENKSSISNFNKENFLNNSRLLLYPFIIAKANGHSKELSTKIFGNFYYFFNGAISIWFMNYILNKESKELEYFNTKSENSKHGLKILNENINDFQNLKELIKDNKINDKPFAEFCIKKDYSYEETPIYRALEYSILALKKQTNNNFFIYDVESLKSIHKIYNVVDYNKIFNEIPIDVFLEKPKFYNI